ncbi:hypothetical protein [Novosphingobium pentaromativorans]|nr:hypothetical protein [Novosphingobium pentaromativorans]
MNPTVDVFRLAMAAGSAAELTPGTDFVFAKAIDRLFALAPKRRKTLSLRP